MEPAPAQEVRRLMATHLKMVAPCSELLDDEAQQRLARWNRDRLEPRLPDEKWREASREDENMRQIEGAFLALLREQVRDAAAAVPTDGGSFVAWFESLEATGPGQHD